MTPPDHPPPPGSSQDWLDRARGDYELAELAAASGHIRPELIGFHAQQAAEKSLKAMLVARGQAVTRTHNLDALLEMVEDAGLEPPMPLHHLGTLTAYAVQARYPSLALETSEDEVPSALLRAHEVLSWAAAELTGAKEAEQ